MKKPTYEELKKWIKELERENIRLKKVEKMLKESKNKYRILLENLPQKIFFKDKNLVYISCNNNYARDLNIKPDEITGKTDYDFFPKKLAEKYRADDKRIMETAKIEDIEEDYIQDGQKVFVHMVKTSIRDEKGNVIGILGIFWDITEHKKLYETLLYERNLFQTLLDNIPDAIYFKDKDAKFVRVSKSMAEFFNTTVENVMGKTDFDFFEKDIAEQSFKDDLNIIKSGISIVNKEEIDVALSGEKRWVLTTKLPWYDKNGNIIGMFGISRDITKRKETEMKLQESEERFRLIFENAGDGIMIVNPEIKRFIYANKKMCDLTGYSLSEILGLGVEELHPKKDLSKVIEEFETKFRGEIELTPNIPVLRKDGTVFYADINSKLVIINGVECLIGIFRDITERKKLEEEKSSMDKLETINNMIVSINHEMNQPLSVITSYSNYLMENAKKESQIYKDAKLINDEAWKLADLIKKISKLKKVKFTEYFPGTDMLDLNNNDNEEVNNE